MFYDIVDRVIGIIKLVFYKSLYPFRVSFSGIPIVSKSTNYSIKRKSNLKIGRKFKCRNNVSLRAYNKAKIIIGDRVFLNERVSINARKQIIIGDNTIIGPGVMLFDHDHDYKHNISNFVDNEIIIGENVWIGAGCIILKGVKIGDNAVIAAGTIVFRDVESNSLVYEKRIVEGQKCLAKNRKYFL